MSVILIGENSRSKLDDEGKKMDYETDIHDLKERMAKVEKRLDDLKEEIRTLFAQMERDSGGSQY